MDRKITSRLNMMNAVNTVADGKPLVVALVPAFVLLVAQSKVLVEELRALMQKITGKKGGAKLVKDEWKAKLSLLLSVLCGQGVSYGKKIGDLQMAHNFNMPVSTFINMRDTELIETADHITDMAQPIANELLDYGISPAFMGDLKEARDNFVDKNPVPTADVYVTEADNEACMAKAFECSEFMFEDFMKAATIFKILDPLFYAALDNAARISNVGIRHDDPEAETVAKALKAAKAEVKKREAAEKKKAKEDKKRQDQEELQRLLAVLTPSEIPVTESAVVPNVEVEQPTTNGTL